MKDYLLAELERSLFDLKRIPRENARGIRQAKAHIRNVRNKLRAMHAGKEAWEIERKFQTVQNSCTL